ncbi:transient receptor potential cation channel subfamily C member 2b [Chanos chanos]|uniref:Transient receptor potential cation channel subfamily C member 2b n=1 Tax=Chanos chanos TaxID=29144 RepID=A0A6J2WXX7_CHACN|nr:short transient receptor potential channel 2-like [Chanos chanos]
MAPIKIKHVVSFTSQDPKSCVENLCDVSGDSKPWLCSPQDHSGVLRVELQMELAAQIGFIDVGNCGSAFIQVDAGRSSWPVHHPYVTLLPATTLMGPADSRQGTGRKGVRMFKKADFLPEGREENWDRLRVTCTQPFNRRVQFGLSFLRVRSTSEDTERAPGIREETAEPSPKTPEKSVSVREWLSSPAVQRTFFGRNTGEGSPEEALRNAGSLNRAGRMVLSITQSATHSVPTTPSGATGGSPTQRGRGERTCSSLSESEPSESSSPSSKAQTPQRRRRTLHTNVRRDQVNSGSSNKRRCRQESPTANQKLSKVLKGSGEPEINADLRETTCPLCGDYLPLHASLCEGEESAESLGVIETAVEVPPTSPPAPDADRDDPRIPCPLCSFRFPAADIQLHASACGDPTQPQMEMENLTPEQWREIVNKKMRFPLELLGAIEEGNLPLVCSLLQIGDGIIRQLDDSEDRQWREALNLSIRLGSEDTMDALLRGVKFDFRQIHEALLVAVDTNQPRVVRRLLDRLDQEKGNKMDVRSFSQAIFDHSIDDSQFAPGVTPLTLACQKDLYEIVTMLTQKGHVIPWPHKISCACLECRNGRQYDLLKFSLSRINTYRGIASRAYLSITADDPMLSAFRLSRDLRKLSKKEPEFKPQYLALEELCQEFAVELLGMCRNQSEVTTILNSCGLDEKDSEDELDKQAFEEGIPNLARLRLAVNYNQKQFVAHPICQQVLSSIWCKNLPGWRGSRTTWKLLVSVGIFFTMPILCLIYWIAPKSKLGKTLKIPVIKFLLHSASYMWFLITLLGESITMEIYRDEFASRQQNILHTSFHMVWVVGFFWFECKEVWIEGLRSYFLDWWNCLDMMVLSMYLASFILRILIMLKGYFLCQSPDSTDECVYFTQTTREQWRQEDPQLIAEVLFAVTSMLSFTRLAYILPAQESLGTLQISIGKMIDDMMRFMFILMIIGTAFLCGINNIYVPYIISPHLGRFNETFRFLFWTMFGVANEDYVDMPDFVVAELVGRILYGIFTLVIVIVLLNMLIAMITNSFQKIEDDADVEWKFARSKLYLSYFREGLTMPVPFNIIPSPKAAFYLIRGIFRRICCCCCNCNSTPEYPPITSTSNGTLKGGGEERVPYKQQVIRALVQRYIESARREFEEAKRKDVGNRITELSKVMGRLHGEMKQIHGTLLDMGRGSADPADRESSILGKYILGAKNNFRGFNSGAGVERRTSPLPVTVHHGDAETNEDVKDNKQEIEGLGNTEEKPATGTEVERGDEGETDEVVEDEKQSVNEGEKAGEAGTDQNAAVAQAEEKTSEEKTGVKGETERQTTINMTEGETERQTMINMTEGETERQTTINMTEERKTTINMMEGETETEIKAERRKVNEDETKKMEEGRANEGKTNELIANEMKATMSIQTKQANGGTTSDSSEAETTNGRAGEKNRKSLEFGGKRVTFMAGTEDKTTERKTSKFFGNAPKAEVEKSERKKCGVSFLARQIEQRVEKTEAPKKSTIYKGKEASSPTNSSDSHDTGFGSQELDPSISTP